MYEMKYALFQHPRPYTNICIGIGKREKEEI